MRNRCFGAVIVFSHSLRLSPAGTASCPDGSGEKPIWTNGNKVGVGTSTTANSKVWFTLGQNGALNEVYYPAIDSANTRTLELIITDGKSFAELESQQDHAVETLGSAALTFTQINTSKSGRYQVRKTYVTDPAQNTVLIQLQLKVLKAGPWPLLYILIQRSRTAGFMTMVPHRDRRCLTLKRALPARSPHPRHYLAFQRLRWFQ